MWFSQLSVYQQGQITRGKREMIKSHEDLNEEMNERDNYV